MNTLKWIRRIALAWIAFDFFYTLAKFEDVVMAISHVISLSIVCGLLYFAVWVMWRLTTPGKKPEPVLPMADELIDDQLPSMEWPNTKRK